MQKLSVNLNFTAQLKENVYMSSECVTSVPGKTEVYYTIRWIGSVCVLQCKVELNWKLGIVCIKLVWTWCVYVL